MLPPRPRPSTRASSTYRATMRGWGLRGVCSWGHRVTGNRVWGGEEKCMKVPTYCLVSSPSLPSFPPFLLPSLTLIAIYFFFTDCFSLLFFFFTPLPFPPSTPPSLPRASLTYHPLHYFSLHPFLLLPHSPLPHPFLFNSLIHLTASLSLPTSSLQEMFKSYTGLNGFFLFFSFFLQMLHNTYWKTKLVILY